MLRPCYANAALIYANTKKDKKMKNDDGDDYERESLLNNNDGIVRTAGTIQA